MYSNRSSSYVICTLHKEPLFYRFCINDYSYSLSYLIDSKFPLFYTKRSAKLFLKSINFNKSYRYFSVDSSVSSVLIGTVHFSLLSRF